MKKSLLERINPNNVIVIDETDKIKLYGVKFYVKNDPRYMFKEQKDGGFLLN